MILMIVVSSTIKGALTGLLAGMIARRVHSLAIGVAAGVVIGCTLSVLAATTSPPGPDGSKHYVEIVIPGMLLGAIVGFATQRLPRPSSTFESRALLFALALPALASASMAAGQVEKPRDDLQPLQFLVGSWRGTSEGTPGKASVERDYVRALNNRFIHVKNRSVYAPQPANAKGEVHEDAGFFSFDRTRRRFVLRQFHVEGFVNQYAAEPATGSKWIFESESIENIPAGWRARETYVVHGPDEIEEVFELAEPGKEYAVYSRARLTRQK